jgi:hypothetical protein
MTPTVWLVIFLGNYECPDFYINRVPFWIDKSRTYFVDPMNPYDKWEVECRKWHQPEGNEYVALQETEEDYD